jgi:hypothetical protein
MGDVNITIPELSLWFSSVYNGTLVAIQNNEERLNTLDTIYKIVRLIQLMIL